MFPVGKNPFIRTQPTIEEVRGWMTRVWRMGPPNKKRLKLYTKLYHNMIADEHNWTMSYIVKRFLSGWVCRRRRLKCIYAAVWGKKVFGEKTGLDIEMGPAVQIAGLLHCRSTVYKQ